MLRIQSPVYTDVQQDSNMSHHAHSESERWYCQISQFCVHGRCTACMQQTIFRRTLATAIC